MEDEKQEEKDEPREEDVGVEVVVVVAEGPRMSLPPGEVAEGPRRSPPLEEVAKVLG